MASFLGGFFMSAIFEVFCVGLLGFLVVNAALSPARAASWRVAWAVVATLLVLGCGALTALAWFGRGSVGLSVWVLIGAIAAGAVSVARVFGAFGRARENRGSAALVVAVTLIGALSVAMVGDVGAADHTIRSVPYEQPVAPVVAPIKQVPRVESAYGLNGGSACRCRSSLVCVGPRGGKYCVTDAGKKRYM